MQHRTEPTDTTAWSRITVVRANGQFAVLAADDVAAGDVLLRIHGRVVALPSRYSVQIGENAHIDLGEKPDLERDMDRHGWRFLNHACDPTAVLCGRLLIARRSLRRFEEVTFDYNTTEFDMASPFRCGCGSARCVGWIAGFRHLTSAQQLERGPFLPPYLRVRLAHGTAAADSIRPPTAS